MGIIATSHAEAHNSSRVAAVCALAAAAIGVTVILGWNIGSESLIAVRPPYTAVQYNAALALLCSSVALLAVVCGRRWLATVTASTVFLLAGATAIEYLAAVDVGIDTLFFNSLVSDNIPGRMAPNTVAAFLCVSAAMILLAWRALWGGATELAASLCAFVAAVGAVAFTGYLANIPSAYEWSPRHPIAMLTTIGFLVISAGAIAAAWHASGEERRGSPRWLPAPVFVLLMSLCGMIAKSMWHTSRIAVLPEARHSLIFATVLVLVFGAAVSSALVAVMKLAEQAYRKSRDLEALNCVLDAETAKSRKAAHYVRSLIEASLDPLVTIDRDGRIMDVNRATEEITGFARQQLIGSDFSDYFTDPEKAREGYHRVFADGSVRDYPLALRHTSGRVADVLYNASIYRGDQGEIEGVFAAARDVTERKRAEQQLLRASHYARSLIECSLDPLVTIGKDGRIMDVNRATEQVTGIGREQLIGSDFSDYFTEPEKAHKGYQQVFALGAIRDYPLAIRSRTGSITDVLYNATLFKDQDGRVEGIFAAARDITDRKRSQQELERYAEELRRSNNELQEFAFVASHDLQEPLRKITAFAERLKERASVQLDATSQDYMARMQNAAQRMAQLIDSLLTYSRVTTRALPFEEVDLAQLMLGVLLDVEQRMRETRARVTIGRLPKVIGDAMQLRQLLQNLLGNALKFHAPEQPPNVYIGASAAADGRCEIFVSDDGIGFDPLYTDKIFRPFQRLHGRNQYEGSGMGLAICRKIAQRHGAPITVRSEPGKGSTFLVSLPAIPDHPAKPNAGALGAPNEGREACQKLQSESSLPKTMTTTTC